MCSANLQQRRKESKVLSLMALSLEQIQFHTTTGIAGIFATTRRNESTSAMERKRDASIVFPSFLRPPRNCIRRGGQESTFRHSYTSTQHSNAATTNDIYIWAFVPRTHSENSSSKWFLLGASNASQLSYTAGSLLCSAADGKKLRLAPRNAQQQQEPPCAERGLRELRN